MIERRVVRPHQRPARQLDQAGEKWEAQAHHIRQQYLSAVSDSAVAPYFEKLATFRRESYRLIRQYLDTNKSAVIRNILIQEDVEPKNLPFKEHEFLWGLLAIDRDGSILSIRRKYREAKILKYAFWHDVEPELLVGFIKQTGSPDEIAAKVTRNEREPWLSAYKGKRSLTL